MDEIKSLLDDINAHLRMNSRDGDIMTTTTFFQIINRLAKAAGLGDHVALRCNLCNRDVAERPEKIFIFGAQTTSMRYKTHYFSRVELFPNLCDKTIKCSNVQPGTDHSIYSACDRPRLYATSQDNDLRHAAKIIPKTSDENEGNLTNRELEVLKWAKDGKSYWETSIIMGISERTVKFHLCNIYRKLNVVNRSQAIAVAVAYGYLHNNDSVFEN
jgi:DNA-binding CsgD family transcriptional regulator